MAQLTGRRIACPACGGDLLVRSAQARSVICQFCDAQIDLSSPDFDFLRAVQRPFYGNYPPPLTVGAELQRPDGWWQVAGHVRFKNTDPRRPYFWDEFILIHRETAAFARLGYDHGEFVLSTPRQPKAALDPRGIQEVVALDGALHEVLERGSAVLDAMHGEVPWAAHRGDVVRWIDARSISLEWTDAEVHVFDDTPLSTEEVAVSLGISPLELAQRCYEIPDADAPPEPETPPPDAPRGIPWVTILLLIIIAIAGIIVARRRAQSHVDRGSHLPGVHSPDASRR